MTERTRREFFGAAVAVTAGSAVVGASPAQAVKPAGAQKNEGGIPLRALGKSGATVSCMGLGGWHVGAIKERKDAIKLMHAAIDEGITFFDNAWDYHSGGSETVMGEALAQDGKRDKVFLMTKNCERDYDGSMRNLEESLKRLKTDHIDLWQFHELNYDNDPQWLLDRGGLKAALEAKKAGKVRYLGFTGHKHPDIHLAALKLKFPWDAVQMPVNILDAQYRSFQAHVMPVAKRMGVGIVGMKSMGGGAPNGTFLDRGRTGLTAEQCVRYALGTDVSTLVVGILSIEQLKQNAALARDFKPLPAAEIKQLQEGLRAEASDGRYELFKSTTHFDGPHHRKQHGFPV